MIAGKAVGNSADVVFSRTREIHIAQDQLPVRYAHQAQVEQPQTRRLAQTYAHPQVYVNSHAGAPAAQRVHRVTPSKQRPSSGSHKRDEGSRPASAGVGHTLNGHATHDHRQPRTDVAIPHSKAPALSEETKQRNQQHRSKIASKRLQQEAELKAREELEQRERMRVAKEAAMKRTSEFARQRKQREARKARSALNRLAQQHYDGNDKEVNRTSFMAMDGAMRTEIPSRSEFVEPIRTAHAYSPDQDHHYANGHHQQALNASPRQLHRPTMSAEPELAFPANQTSPPVAVRSSQSAWNAEMKSDGVAGIFEAISAAQNAVPRLSHRGLAQERPDLLESYKAQLRTEPETTHEIVPDIPLRLRRSRRSIVEAVNDDSDDAATHEPPAHVSPPQNNPPPAAVARQQPVLNPRAPSPSRLQSEDHELLMQFDDALPEDQRPTTNRYSAEEKAREYRRKRRLEAREKERKQQERMERLKLLNARAAAGRLSRKRPLKRTSGSAPAYRRPVSAEAGPERLSRRPLYSETTRSVPALEYLAPPAHNEWSDASVSDYNNESPVRMVSTAPASRPRTAPGRARVDVNEGRHLRKRANKTTSSPQWNPSATSDRRRLRSASPPQSTAAALEAVLQQTALDDIYNNMYAHKSSREMAEEGAAQPATSSRRRNRIVLPANRTSPHKPRESSEHHYSKTSPAAVRRPLYGSSEDSDTGSKLADDPLHVVVEKTTDFRDNMADLYNQLCVEFDTNQLHSSSDTEAQGDTFDRETHRMVGARRAVSPAASPARLEPRASPARAALLSPREHELVARASQSPPLPRSDMRSDAEWVLMKHGVLVDYDMTFPERSPSQRLKTEPARIRLPETELPARRQTTRRYEDMDHLNGVREQLDERDPFSVVDRFAKRSRPSTRTSFDRDDDEPLRASLEEIPAYLLERPQQRSHAVTQTDRPQSPDRRDVSVEALSLPEEDEAVEDDFQPRSYWDSLLQVQQHAHNDFLPPEEEEAEEREEEARPQRRSPAEVHWQLSDALQRYAEVVNVGDDIAFMESSYIHSVQSQQLAALRSELDHALHQHKQVERDALVQQQLQDAWRAEVIAAAIRDIEEDNQAQIRRYQEFAHDEIAAGYMELGVEQARLQARHEVLESQREAERLARPVVLTSMAATQTVATPELHAPPTASVDAGDTYSDDFDVSDARAVSHGYEAEVPFSAAPRVGVLNMVSRSVQVTDDSDAERYEDFEYDSDSYDLDPVDDLVELKARIDRCRQKTAALEKHVDARRQAGFKALEEFDQLALSGSIDDLEEIKIQRTEYLQDYERKLGSLERRLYRLQLKEYRLMRTFLRLTAPDGERRLDDDTTSVLSSLLEAPTRDSANVVTDRYSRSGPLQEDDEISYDRDFATDEVASDVSEHESRPVSAHESIQDDGYSSGFDEESDALVRHSHRLRVHDVSYVEDERVSVSEESVRSEELVAHERELRGKYEEVWQHVMRRVRSRQKADKLQQLNRDRATIELAGQFFAWLEQARLEGDESEMEAGAELPQIEYDIPDHISGSQRSVEVADTADTIGESYDDTFEPEVGTSVHTAGSVHTEHTNDEHLRGSVESEPEVEYSSFAATGSGPGILESPHPSSDEAFDVNRSVDVNQQREQELLRTIAQQEEEMARMRQLLAEREAREQQQLRDLQRQAEQARVEEEQRRRQAEQARAEEEQRRLQAEQARAEEERRRLEAEQARAEEERRRLQAEQAWAEEEQRRLQAEQQAREAQLPPEIESEHAEDEFEEDELTQLSDHDADDQSARLRGLMENQLHDIHQPDHAGHHSEVYDDSFASSSGMYPDVVIVAGSADGAAALLEARDEVIEGERADSMGYDSDSFATSEGEREQSVAEVASIPEEVHSDEGEVQDNERMPHLDSVDDSASLLPDDAFNASMSVEAFEGSISHADVLLPARQPSTERVDSPEASPSRPEEQEGQEQEEASESDEHATTEEALVENVQDAIADGSAVPLHLRMTDSRYSMSDDDYGEAYSVDSDTLQAGGSDFGSPVPSRHQMRSPTRELTVVVPAAPELDTIEEEDSAPVQAPADGLDASMSVENLDGSMSYADFSVPVASPASTDYVDIITSRLLGEMLQEIASEVGSQQHPSEDSTQVQDVDDNAVVDVHIAGPEDQQPLETETAAKPVSKLQLTLPDPDSTAELRLSEPMGADDSDEDLYSSVAAHTPQAISAPRAGASREVFGDDMQDHHDDDDELPESQFSASTPFTQLPIFDEEEIRQAQIVQQSKLWNAQDDEFCQAMVSAVSCWDSLYSALLDRAAPPQIDDDDLFMDIQASLWDRAREQGEDLDKVVTGTRNYAHFERVNQILQDLHHLRYAPSGTVDLPTRLQVEAIDSGNALRDYVADILDRERQEYRRNLERRSSPDDLCRLPPISVSNVQQQAGVVEGDLVDKLVEALLHSLLQDTTQAVLDVL